MNKHRLNVAHSKAIHTERGAARTRAEHARASVVMELIESNHDVDTSLCAVPQHSASTDRPRVCRACAEFFAQHSTATGCEQAIIGRIAARGLARPSIGLLTYTYI